MYALIFAPKVPVTIFEVTSDWDPDVELEHDAFDAVSVSMVDSVDQLRKSPLVNEDYRQLYFRATNQEAPKKFKSKSAAAERVWPYMSKVAVIVADDDVAVYMHDLLGTELATPKPKVKKTSAPKGTRKSKGINLEPQEIVHGIKEGTRQWVLARNLQDGVSIPQLTEYYGFPWSIAAIKSGMYWDLHRIKGYGIRTEFHNGKSLYERQDVFGAKHLGVKASQDGDMLSEPVFDDDYDENKTLPVYFLVFPDHFAEKQILLKG